MNKIIGLVFTALVAAAFADDAQPAAAAAPAVQPLIPQVATFCKNGCPSICSAAEQLCKAFPPKDSATACPALKTSCETECGKLCTCIEGCGPSCDAFEENCKKDSLEPLQQFCPFTGGVCDVTCIIGCPQKMAVAALQKLFADNAKSFQTFLAGLFATKKTEG